MDKADFDENRAYGDAYDISFDDFYRDLIAPLSIMYMNIQLLEKQHMRKEIVVRYLKSIKNNWFQMMKVINDTADNQKIREGRLRPFFQDTDIIALLKKVAEHATQLSMHRNIALSYSFASQALNLAIDVEIVERIVLNLLCGALQRAGEGGHVTLTCKENGEYFTITIADDGVGIDQKILESLLKNNGAPQMGSYVPKGITGSTIVKQLANLIYAWFSVDMDESGTRITIFIPVFFMTKAALVHTSENNFYHDNIFQIEFSVE